MARMSSPIRRVALTCGALLVLAGCTSAPVAPPPFAVGEIRTFAGAGIGGYNGGGRPLDNVWLNAPCDVTVDEARGDVWIVDYNNGRIRLAPAGVDTLRDVAGVPLGLPLSDPNLLNHPSALVFDAHGGRLLLAWHNHQIRRIEADGAISMLWGVTDGRGFGGDGGPARDAQFAYPSSAVWGGDSTLYISDEANVRIRAVRPDAADLALRTVVTIAGSGDTTLAAEGAPALETGFDAPRADITAFPALRLAISRDHGTLYVADTFHHRVRTLDLTQPSHPVRTIAGSGPIGEANGAFAGDGGPALAARLNAPTDVDLDRDGTLYVCDMRNHCVRAIAPDGMIRTVAGSGVRGTSGDGGPATQARLDQPNGIALDTQRGLLYIAELGGNRVRVVRLR